MKQMRSASAVTVGAIVIALAACAKSTIHVVGVMRQSSEMRPLPNVPLGGYQQLHVLVRAAPGQSAVKYGSQDCGYTVLEGSDEGEDLKNAACVPTETSNAAITIVRQRLRSYGINVVREGSEPYDFLVEVSVTGDAPKRADRTLVRAVATVALKIHASAPGTLVGDIDTKAASAAFDSVSKSCGLQNGTLSSFFASATEPMTPDFDIVALAGGAVDNLLRCYDLARFFLDAQKQFPKPQKPDTTPLQTPPQPR
jgi:hypothetical protein